LIGASLSPSIKLSGARGVCEHLTVEDDWMSFLDERVLHPGSEGCQPHLLGFQAAIFTGVEAC
jgi:hypothetical protein